MDLTVHEEKVFGLFDQIMEKFFVERQLNARLHLLLLLVGDQSDPRLNAAGRNRREKLPLLERNKFFSLKLLPQKSKQMECQHNKRQQGLLTI